MEVPFVWKNGTQIIHLNPRIETSFGRRNWASVIADKRKAMEVPFLWASENSIMHLNPKTEMCVGRRDWISVLRTSGRPWNPCLWKSGIPLCNSILRLKCVLDGVPGLPYLRTSGSRWRKFFYGKTKPPLCISILGLQCPLDGVTGLPYLRTSGNRWPLYISIPGLRCSLDAEIELPYLRRARTSGCFVFMEQRTSILHLNPSIEMFIGRRDWINVFANKAETLRGFASCIIIHQPP